MISCEEGPFHEGSSVVVIFSAVIVEEDGFIVRVGGVKGMSFFDCLKVTLKVQTPYDRAGDRGLVRRSQQTACGGVGQVWGPRIPIR